MKKFLSWILLLCLILTAIPFSAVAGNEVPTPPTTPTVQEAPADAKPITDLASLMLPATASGNYKLTDDLFISLDMIDAYYANPDDPNEKVTYVKDENGDQVYVTAEGKIAYDKTTGTTKPNTAEGASGNLKDANGDDIYFTAEGKIAYDTATGVMKRGYTFTSALITTSNKYAEIDGLWESNKAGLAIYGGGHTITFEEGIIFSGCSVLVNKAYGAFSLYDLNLGSPENGVEVIIASVANISMVCGGTVDSKNGDELLEASLYVDNVSLYGSIDETVRTHDNNVGGFCGKPAADTEVTIKNSNAHVDIFRTKVKSNGLRNANYAGFIGTWQGSSLLIENCNNYGTMYGEMNAYKFADGGVAGFVATTHYSTSPENSIVLRNCVNYGTMIGSRLAAGMIANCTVNATLENCVNRGEIRQCDEGESTLATSAAGLIARVSAGTVTLTGCANESSKITEVSPNPNAVTAGLVGLIYNPENVIMTDCFSFTAADISMVKGAAIRFDFPTKLRFRAVLSDSLIKMLAEKYGEGKYKLGMKIAKLSDYEAAGSFEALTAEQVLVVDGTWFDEEKTSFVATTQDLTEAEYGVQYIATAYVTLIDDQGMESTVYATVDPANARSASDVAKAALADRVPVAIALKGYIYEIEKGSFSMYTKAGNEKLRQYVVADSTDAQ